jgi:hypothetical protein
MDVVGLRANVSIQDALVCKWIWTRRSQRIVLSISAALPAAQAVTGSQRTGFAVKVLNVHTMCTEENKKK